MLKSRMLRFEVLTKPRQKTLSSGWTLHLGIIQHSGKLFIRSFLI